MKGHPSRLDNRPDTKAETWIDWDAVNGDVVREVIRAALRCAA